jgi:hypothetical protein
MIETGVLREIRGALIPADKWMDEGDARRIHSVITGGGGRPIVDALDGQLALSDGGAGGMSGTVFIGGKYRRVTSTAAGDSYLERSKVGDEHVGLAVLPAVRGRSRLERVVVWSIAEAQGYDPRVWRRFGNRLITWGGAANNCILADMLAANGLAQKPKAAEFEIRASSFREFDLNHLRELGYATSAMATTKGLLGRYFVQPSRYYSSLSPEAKRREAINSIPYPAFLRWLRSCDRIEREYPDVAR